MTKAFIYHFVLIFVYIGAYPSFSQQIGITPVKIEQELPSLSVNKTFQDSEGYIWFATAYGLSRFDAFNLLTFKLKDEKGDTVANQNILAVSELDDKLLLGAENGIYVLEKETYRISPFPDERLEGRRVAAILVDRQSKIWIGTQDAIYVYNRDFSLHAAFEQHPDNGKSIPDGSINFIFQDKKGEIWAGIWDAGLHKLDKEKGQFLALPPIGRRNNPFKIIQDDRGQLWISTWGDGLFLFNPEGGENMYREIIIKNKRRGVGKEDLVYNIVQDRLQKYIWVLSYSGISTFHYTDEGRIAELNLSHLFQYTSNFFQDIYQDRSGTLWLAISGKGVSTISFDKPVMRAFALPQVQEKYNISPNLNMLYQDRENQLWFNLERIGLGKFVPQTNQLATYSNLRFKDLVSLRAVNCALEIDDELWVGGAYETIMHVFRKENGSLALSRTIDLAQYASEIGVPLHLFQDTRKNLWIGTNRGLMYKKSGQEQLHQVDDVNGHIMAICQDVRGSIWVATKDHGIYQIDNHSSPKSKRHVGKATAGLQTNQIETMDTDSRGHLWIGTKDNRLLSFHTENGQVREYANAHLLAPNQILHVVCLDSTVWFSTTRAVYKLFPGSNRIFEYSSSDGIPINMFTKGAYTADKAQQTVYFGGHNGIVQFWESSFAPTHKSAVVISDIKINNQSTVSLGLHEKYDSRKQSLVLEPEDQSLEILFSSFEYTHPGKIRYAYKLEGVDKDWVYAPRERIFATYNNLGKGRYTFLIKATDLDNRWSSEVTRLHIHKKPAFYESNVAYMLYAILILGLAYAIIRFYVNRLKLQSDLRIAQIEKENANKLVQTKLSYFTNISHELLTPLTIISCLIDDAQMITKKNLSQFDKMRFNLDRLKRLLQQILDFKRVENRQMALRVGREDLITFMSNICTIYFSPLAKRKNINFEVSPGDCLPETYFDADKLDKIIFNILSNAFKYTASGGSVKLVFHTEPVQEFAHLVVQVQDTGMGIAQTELDKIFIPFYNNKQAKQQETNGIGLALTKELVELHHGSIKVDSILGQGSTFTVCLPVEKAAYTAEELRELHDSFIDSANLFEEVSDASVTLPTPVEGRTDIKILLVEDNVDLLQTVHNVLSRTYSVVTAQQGEEALAILQKQEIDVVISDIMMPVMDGLTLCRRIKQDPEINHIPVILLTAKNSIDDRIACYQAGGDSYISKPFDLKVLEARIHNFLTHKRTKQEDFKASPQINISTLDYTPQDEQFVEKMIGVVEENLTDDQFDVVALGNALGLSKSTLYRKTKALLDLSPSEFVKNIRLKHACQMMEKDKSISVSEVAFATGFSDPRYFSTCFKAEFGVTPSEYQKRKTHRIE
ncbi:hybrid sensor histidine kinase/response regulator transcription factor [Sphingobacterium haloxyli]|uniref:histidine kinase n=1 Tax=Sphingobacterium haloxyli TaxID=2100533 RepID=A0A2S9J5X9_9SPHI|nr:response regulator [Sphingobacterium haloxyli]PRD48185.1 hybrid sensor histidine kinase/response regulator [Sphingobacterium haloxyli]